MINSHEIAISEDAVEKSNDVKKGRIISYEDALAEIGFGRAQLEVLFAMAFVLINVFNETMGISIVLPAAVCDLHLTSSTKGLLTSMVFFGIMVSSYVWGYLGDVKGRRWVILWTLLFSTIFTIISVFMNNFVLFAACRFMVGIFVAGYSGALYAYIGEFNVSKYRASMISWISIAIGVSTTFMPLISMWLLSYEWKFELYSGFEFKPWRLCMLVYAIPGVIAILWILRFPESPRFMLSVNQNDEALEGLRWIYRTNKRTLDSFDIDKLKTEPSALSGSSMKGVKSILVSLKNQTLPLIKPPHLKYFAATCALQFGTFWAAGGVSLFLPDIFNQLTIAREDYSKDFRVCDIYGLKKAENFTVDVFTSLEEGCADNVNTGVFTNISYLGYAYIIGFTIVALIIRPNRRRLIIGGTFLLSAIAGFILPFVYQYNLIVICFFAFIFFCGINVSLINGTAVDLFPINLRAMAVSLGMLFGRFGSTAAANVIGNLIDSHCEVTYFTSAGVVAFCFIVSFVITKNQDES